MTHCRVLLQRHSMRLSRRHEKKSKKGNQRRGKKFFPLGDANPAVMHQQCVSLLSRSKCNFHKSKIFRGAVTDKINCCRVLLPMRLTYQNRGICLELHLMYLELQTFSLNGLHDSSIMWLRNENVARDVASFCLCYTTLYYYDINSSI